LGGPVDDEEASSSPKLIFLLVLLLSVSGAREENDRPEIDNCRQTDFCKWWIEANDDRIMVGLLQIHLAQID
jgi:hypothetical protein